jgi:signal transduction histidine kinase
MNTHRSQVSVKTPNSGSDPSTPTPGLDGRGARPTVDELEERLEAALKELKANTRARERVIHHLAHELGTPLAIIAGVLARVSKNLETLDAFTLREILERGNRSLKRLFDLRTKIEDVMRGKPSEESGVLKLIEDALSLVEEARETEADERGRVLLSRIAQRLRSVSPVEGFHPEEIRLDVFLHEMRAEAVRSMGAREVDIVEDFQDGLVILMDAGVLRKVCAGLLQNAIENTPDQGRIKLKTRSASRGTRIEVCDCGTGIHPLDRKAIFGGFFHTQDNSQYSTKKPYEFGAGGRGADLLRMKVFSQRYRFSIGFESKRCRFMPEDSDRCPGRISNCGFVGSALDCLSSGGSRFWIVIPPHSHATLTLPSGSPSPWLC